MLHPHTEVKFISPEVGSGVFATKLIPAGTITWVGDELDREFTPVHIEQMPAHYRQIAETYSFRNNKGNYVFCWDNTRFINHSFNANCLPTAYNFEIAIRDISPGEQMTNDYGCFNIIEAFEPYGEENERKKVYPDDLIRYHSEWDKKVTAVFPSILKQNQPLKNFLPHNIWDEIKLVAQSKKVIRSVKENHFNPSHNEHSARKTLS